jgi:hypothetical protein
MGIKSLLQLLGAINWQSSYWQQGQPIGLDLTAKGIKDPPAKRDRALRK